MMIINLAGLALIGFIIWWFWLYKPTQVEVSGDELTIVVENGIYQPANINIKPDQPTTLIFLRKDASPCAGTVLFPAFEISTELPLNKAIKIKLPVMKQGEYAFHCQMQMYKGTVTVN